MNINRRIHETGNCRTSKRGSLIVEAAISLPIFVLAVLTLILIIRLIGCAENVMYYFAEEAGRVGKEAYVTNRLTETAEIDPIAPVAVSGLPQMALQQRLRRCLEENEAVHIEHLRVDQFIYLFPGVRLDGLITGRLTYEIELPLPASLNRRACFGERLLWRGFIGRTGSSSPLPYSQMEQNQPANPVYVFPKAGERFHASGCRIIAVDPVERILNAGIRRSYAACRLCQPQQAADGGIVYCFPKGKSYHRGSCFLVKRYVVEMEKCDAEARGYTPCSFCKIGT